MTKCYRYLVLFMIVTFNQAAKAQGCSDAGVCTVGSMSPNFNDLDTSKFKLTAMFVYGSGEQGVAIQTAQVEADFTIYSRLKGQIKLPYTLVQGNLGNNQGLGDIIANVSYPFSMKFGNITPTIGMRFATGNSNATVTDEVLTYEKPLPMPYQTSLGTNDLLMALSSNIRGFQLGIGLQIPFGNNKNQFNDSGSNLNGNLWKGNADAAKYFSSVELKRAPDLVIRLEKSVVKNKWVITPGLLAIMKLAEDQQLVWISGFAGFSQIYRQIPGSKGLTLNAMLNFKYLISDKSRLLIGAASPFVVRENRPDGLTRSLVASIGYEHKF